MVNFIVNSFKITSYFVKNPLLKTADSPHFFDQQQEVNGVLNNTTFVDIVLQLSRNIAQSKKCVATLGYYPVTGCLSHMYYLCLLSLLV